MALLLILLHIRLFPYAEDDAYIHFRIATHFVKYGAPYFNVGEPIYATSSIGWTLLVSFVFKFVTQNPIVMAVLNGLITTAGAFLFKRLLQQLTQDAYSPVYYGIFVWLYVAQVSLASLSLMETPFALLLLAIGLLLLVNERPLCLVVLGWMVFTRLEYGAVFVLALTYCLFQKTFSIKTMVQWCALGVAPFMIFAFYFWGTLIPNTVLAKQRVYSLSFLQSAKSLANSLLPNFSYNTWRFEVDSTYKIAYFVTLLILIALFVVYEIRTKPFDKRQSIFYLLLASGLGIMGVYFLKRVLVFGWYMPLYTVPISLGLYGIVILNKHSIRWAFVAAMLPWFVGISGYFSQTFLSAALNNPTLYPNFATGARVRKYIQLGETLYQQYPDATLMAPEIGGLGYGYAGYIFDGVGLVSPQAIQFHPMRVPEERSSGYYGAIPVQFIKLVNPDLIVSYDIFVESFLRSELVNQYVQLQEPVFLEDDLQRSQSKQIWGSSHLYVFIRKDLIKPSP